MVEKVEYRVSWMSSDLNKSVFQKCVSRENAYDFARTLKKDKDNTAILVTKVTKMVELVPETKWGKDERE
jgi:hypothetical protein